MTRATRGPSRQTTSGSRPCRLRGRAFVRQNLVIGQDSFHHKVPTQKLRPRYHFLSAKSLQADFINKTLCSAAEKKPIISGIAWLSLLLFPCKSLPRRGLLALSPPTLRTFALIKRMAICAAWARKTMLLPSRGTQERNWPGSFTSALKMKSHPASRKIIFF